MLAGLVGGLGMRQAGVAGDDQRRLLDQLRDQAGVGTWALTAVGPRPSSRRSFSISSRRA